MNKYLEAMKKELILRDYAKNTRVAYCSYIKRYLDVCSEMRDLSRSDKIKYFLSLYNESLPAKKIALSAIKFFYKYVIRIPIDFFIISFRSRKRIPKVLSPEQVTKLLAAIKNPKHRLMIALMFGAGLRVSELVNLKVEDVQLDRRSLNVRNSKNKKDRVTILPLVLLEPLRIFMEKLSIKSYLFCSNMKPKYSIRTIQTIFKRALLKSGIKIEAGCHVLRHSFATNLLENGTNILIIKDLLGHQSVKTTMIYTHVSDNKRKEVKSPLTAF